MMQQQKHASPDRKQNPSFQRSSSPYVAEAGAKQAAPLQFEELNIEFHQNPHISTMQNR